MAISREMRKQFDRLERCYRLLDLRMSRRTGATASDIEKIEATTGITVDEDLKSMWLYSNGSGLQPWFICDAEGDRELLNEVIDHDTVDAECFGSSVFNLYSTDRVIESWSSFKDIDEQNPGDWATNSPDSFAPQKLDKRIGPQLLRHNRRLPFGWPFLGSDELLFDACPSKRGKYGQIVEYRHDPDSLTFVASSFASFFDRSIEWMERLIPRNPDKARRLLCDPDADFELWLEARS